MKRFKRYILIIIFIMLSFLLLVYAYGFLDKLDLSEQREGITIYDIEGNVMYESNFKKNMQWVSIEEIPQMVQDGFVAVEDKRFFLHAGFDPIRLSKALFNNIMAGGIVEGGSSITQQYAKNLFLTNDQTIARKIEESFYTVRLEMQYSKQEILEGYLNTLYFGHGIYGIQNAAQYFFNVSLSDLTLPQLAMLIGIPNGPSIYSPYISMKNATDRQHLIIDLLKSSDMISEEQAVQAKNEVIILATHDTKDNAGNDEFYVNAVLNELETRDDIDIHGELQVHTYYDPNIQATLQDSIQSSMSLDNELETAAIIVQPFTGNILALSGGKDYTLSQYNRAIHAQRQVASTIKPLLYYTALQQGFTPSSTFVSQPTTFKLDDNTQYTPSNYDDKYPKREISMINAVSMSDNIYAVKTHLFLGMDTLHSALLDFGIKQSIANPSEALGTVNMSVLELSKIYNTFASEGLYIEPSFINKIMDDEDVVYERTIEPKRLLQRDETLVLNQILTSTYDQKNMTVGYPTMTGFAPKVKVGAKSGTSDWDVLIAGFNPDYTITIWNGFDDNRILDREYYDIGKSIFKKTFNALYENKEGAWYQPSDQIEVKTVDPISGLESATGSDYWYIK